MAALLLTNVNVWLDAIFFTLYPIIVVVLGIHFLFNIITKRAYKRFVLWQWPHHEGPPIPFLPKFLHFQHVSCMFLLAFSGMYIRFPFFDGGRTAMRWVHYFAMIVVTINLVWRLWYAFYSKARDYKEFAITKRDVQTLFQVVSYYIFIKPSKPHLSKYNIMQKAVYICFAPMLAVQAVSGFALLTFSIPLIEMTPRQLLVGWWLGPLVGGVAMAGAWTRVFHYFMNWLFIVFTTIHVYLSVTEDAAAFLRFFFLGGVDEARARKKGIVHDEHGGHEPEPEHAPAMTEAME